MATLYLVFCPRKLVRLTDAEYEQMNRRGTIERKQQRNREWSQSERSVLELRRALFWSLILVLGAIGTAVSLGRLYYRFGGLRHAALEELLQYIGTAVLLWATLGKVGWSIQTTSGNSIPEGVNEFVFRVLYVVGSFLIALAITLTYAGTD